MYKAKLWGEDKLNNNLSGYNSSRYENIFANDKKADIKYNEQKYGLGERDISSDYIRREEQKDNDDKEKFSSDEEVISFKSANQTFEENKMTKKPSSKVFLSIEDAIKKAIEEEKEIIVMDY